MRARLLVSAILAAAITACESESTHLEPEPAPPDAAIGTYDKQATGQTRSANCSGDVVVDGAIYITADYYWTKIDINSTPSGSSVCGFIGGSWVRNNATTLTLTPSVAGFGPAQVTVVGDDLTFTSTNALYKRRK